jgi:hypothetical protein
MAFSARDFLAFALSKKELRSESAILPKANFETSNVLRQKH